MESAKALDWNALEDASRWPVGMVRADIAAAVTALRASLIPAGADAVALWVEFLLDSYRGRPRAPAFADMEKRMWLAALGHWPADVLEAAVTQWCLEVRPFPPAVPGELKALGEPILAARLSLLYRAEKMLKAPEAPETGQISSEAIQKLLDRVRLAPTRPKPPGALAKHFAARRELAAPPAEGAQ